MPRPLCTPVKDPVPIVQEAGWAPGPVWTGVGNLAPTGIWSTVHPARSQSLYWLSYLAHFVRLTYCKSVLHGFSKKSRRHLRILCARKVTFSSFHTLTNVRHHHTKFRHPCDLVPGISVLCCHVITVEALNTVMSTQRDHNTEIGCTFKWSLQCQLSSIIVQIIDKEFGIFTYLPNCRFSNWNVFLIHLAVCLTTGLKPFQKQALHIVQSRAFSFRCEYPLLSLRSSSSFLRVLPRLSVTSFPTFIFPSTHHK
jgi:hypothetical protein